MDIGIIVSTHALAGGNGADAATAHAWTDDAKRFAEVEERIAFRLTHPEGVGLPGNFEL